MLGCALVWAGWGHPRLPLSINMAFGASYWLASVCSWAWDSFTVFWVLLVISCSDARWVGGPVVCLGWVSSFRTFSEFIFWITQAPNMIKIFTLKVGF